MTASRLFVSLILVLVFDPHGCRRRPGKEDPEFVKKSPTIGEPLPDLTRIHRRRQGVQDVEPARALHRARVRLPDLTAVPVERLRSGGGARDYGPKDVKFFFVYKALAHPERDGMLQPFTQEERLPARPRRPRSGSATRSRSWWTRWTTGSSTRLGDRNNSEFIIDPEGKIVRKRTWSNPDAVRKDLEDWSARSRR